MCRAGSGREQGRATRSLAGGEPPAVKCDNTHGALPPGPLSGASGAGSVPEARSSRGVTSDTQVLPPRREAERCGPGPYQESRCQHRLPGGALGPRETETLSSGRTRQGPRGPFPGVGQGPQLPLGTCGVGPKLYNPVGLGPWGFTLQFYKLSSMVWRMAGPGYRTRPRVFSRGQLRVGWGSAV